MRSNAPRDPESQGARRIPAGALILSQTLAPMGLTLKESKGGRALDSGHATVAQLPHMWRSWGFCP